MNKTNNEKTSLILHGHFYQPPRENPDTTIISKQSSAYPYSDWNEKIYESCYRANSQSRYLSQNGRIKSITNNYEYLSFNFGPTLLHWMEKYHKETVEKIIEGDRLSQKRLGKGNAIAQSFNHTILPLDNLDNASLQLDWGIMDFIKYFKRDPEGIWLPECAINSDIIDLVAEKGIKFVILSPWQCKAVENEKGEMITLSSNPAPSDRAYILRGKKGEEISAFFYDPTLSTGISFGHFLRSADTLYSTLLELKKKKRGLVHTATDGEIYGHHEPFGDMALAALINKVNEKDDFIFDNYSSFLDKHPATEHAILLEGEEKKGTSWSCSHGVSRWYKDCGCNTGSQEGWNQKWRTPLREALNNLAVKEEKIYKEEVEKIFPPTVTPLSLLKEAGLVFTGSVSMLDFIKEKEEKYNISHEEGKIIAKMLEGMKLKHFSFTSCGWFFSELSGLEPMQCILYALSALSLFQPYSEEELTIPFLSDLKKAKSNIKEKGDGSLIAQSLLNKLPGDIEATVYFYLNRTLQNKDYYSNNYGKYELTFYKSDKTETKLTLLDTSIGESQSYRLLPSSSIGQGINLFIGRDSGLGMKSETFRITNKEIPERILDEAYQWIDSSLFRIDYEELENQVKAIRVYSLLLKQSNGKLDSRIIENLGVALRCLKSILLYTQSCDCSKLLEPIKSLVTFILEFGRSEEKSVVEDLINNFMIKISLQIKSEGLTKENASIAIWALKITRELTKEPEIRDLQDVVYPYKTGEKKCKIDQEELTELYSVLNFD